MVDPERRAQLALYLTAIGCTCAEVEIVERAREGDAALADVVHDNNCPVLRRNKARDQ